MSGTASGYALEAATVRQWFEDEWESGVPIHLIENSEFRDKPSNAAWARLSVEGRDAVVAGIGGPTARYRHLGDIIVEIFAPPGVGDGRARQLADLACEILRSRAENGIQVWAPRAVPVGVRDGWYKINVLAPFWRDEDFTLHPT